MDDLLKWRREFPVLEKTTYLISNSLGAMPRSVYGRMQEYAETWATRGVRAWAEEWWELPVRGGDIVAPLIGAGPGEVSMHPNVTLMEAIVLSCFDDDHERRGRKKIVCEDQNFPSVLYLLRAWAESRRCELVLVPSRDGVCIDTQEMLDAIDERTLLVPISHVLFKSAYIQDAMAIIEKAHRVGAYVLLDAYHSVGILPVDVKALEVDFLVGGVLKWLCGGPGGGFLYVRPDLLRTLKPRLAGWFAHRRPFDFDVGPLEYREDSFRFLNGTPAIPALYAATEGPRIIGAIGVKAIRAKSERQTALLVELAEECAFRLNTPHDGSRRGGTVTIDVPHGLEVSRELRARSILVDYRRGAGIRIAPHFYNSDDEVRLAIDQIVEILKTKAYERHAHTQDAVT